MVSGCISRGLRELHEFSVDLSGDHPELGRIFRDLYGLCDLGDLPQQLL